MHMALAIFQDETTGFNDRAAALAAAALSAYESPNAENVAAIRADRESLHADLVEVFGSDEHGNTRPYADQALLNFAAGLHATLDKISLVNVLDSKLGGVWTTFDANPSNGPTLEDITEAGIADLAALEARAEAAGVTDPE
jgi:hypothetical protein